MLTVRAEGCGYPGSPAHASVKFTNEVISRGTEAIYNCDRGFELLGPSRRVCGENGTWIPSGIPFCVLNVAAGKAPMQSSIVGQGIPQKAVDGSTSTFFNAGTCTMTEAEAGKTPWWYVNLLEPYMVQLVRVDFGTSCCPNNRQATVVVRVGNNRPDLGVNPICNKFIGPIEEGRPLFLPCSTAMPGAFVSIHLENPRGHPLSICEALVYTDQALPIERCPSFRDQPLGSTATYNGKCYIFYNNQPMNFREARRFCAIRGGSLIDETNPALQGFLSWELYRRHRNDPNGQYWLGAVRDPRDRNNWKWINGRDVTISFWNLPGTNENCSRFVGAKGWLWSDTNCDLNLNLICQHRPTTCGKPERPANSTILARNFEIGSVIEYRCSSGHLLVGPNIRTCLPSGVFTEFPPKCRYLECGPPATIPNGGYELVNDTRDYLSGVQYFCDKGFILIGRSFLVCDVDERWNGPPPRCEPVLCDRPPGVDNGIFRMTASTATFGTILEYICNPGYKLVGQAQIACDSNGYWDGEFPVCKKETSQDFAPSAPKPSIHHPPPVIKVTTETATVKVKTTTLTPTTSVTPITKQPQLSSRPSLINKFQIGSGHRPWEGPKRHSTTNSITSTPLPFLHKTPEIPPRYNFYPRYPNAHTTKSPKSAFSSAHPIVTFNPKRKKVPDTLDIRTVSPFGVDESENRLGKREEESLAVSARLNMGGIISLGVFGGFVFLAAIITIVVIIVRRMGNKKNSKQSLDNTTVSTYDSNGSGNRGLHKYYKQAWENLRYDGKGFSSKHETPHQHHHHHHHNRHPVTRQETLDKPRVRGNGRGTVEGFREANEILVSDVAALYSRPEKPKHKASSHHSMAPSVYDPDEIEVWYNHDHETSLRRSKY
ncbi:sushi, von Willebrand factor type A, EGF and pentraxin domain-containing protein 1-like isoform X2 [Tachypleus tridentatus]|uniref:sushi, von Willebrand factor type A, EGF and pentraxin domain-containing protein 1-like isoform X2 n=1 Tax=Tachypleus tridentatus TaxID=6853 RepID=UPI003FD57766